VSVVQIAAQAGVSIATVSRVLNNSRRVNPKLAEQVHKAMVELNFDPSHLRRRAARRAEQQQVSTIAIVSVGQSYRGWFEIPVIAQVVAEISRVSQEHHLSTFITEMVDATEFSSTLKRQPVDGALLFISSGHDMAQVTALSTRLPVVRVMGGQLAPLEIDHVGPDNTSIGQIAATYLIDAGCKELCFLTTKPAWDMCKMRGHGFLTASIAAGIRPSMLGEGDMPNLDIAYGGAAAGAADLNQIIALLKRKLAARANPSVPLGLFISRDEETMFVHRLLVEADVAISRDLVVVSCDNEEVRLSAIHPRPASIDLNAAQIAKHSVQRLLDRIRRPQEPPVRMLVTPRLVKPGEGASDMPSPMA
jgi:LacI family transcriptional regulator